jgi:hypothetical protein
MDVMAFFIVFLVLLGTIALAPWLGADSRGLNPTRHESAHPLSPNAGMNRS